MLIYSLKNKKELKLINISNNAVQVVQGFIEVPSEVVLDINNGIIISTSYEGSIFIININDLNIENTF